jgi:hypothetical protein
MLADRLAQLAAAGPEATVVVEPAPAEALTMLGFRVPKSLANEFGIMARRLGMKNQELGEAMIRESLERWNAQLKPGS